MTAPPVELGQLVKAGGPAVAAESVGGFRPVVEGVGAHDRAGLPQHPQAVVGAAEQHDRGGARGETTSPETTRHPPKATERALVFEAKRKLRDAMSRLPSKNATTDGSDAL